MRLVEWKGGEVVVAAEAMFIAPFKAVYDKNDDREMAFKELGYVFLVASMSSPYSFISDDKERCRAARSALCLPQSWKPDRKVEAAIDFYEDNFTTSAALLLQDTRSAVDKLRRVLRDIDFTKTDSVGKPLYTLQSVVSAIKTVPQLVKDLDVAERAVRSEEQQSGRMRGSGEKSLLDDGFDILQG